MKKIKLGVIGLGYPAFDYKTGTDYYQKIIKRINSREYIEPHVITEPVLAGNCSKIADQFNKKDIDLLLVVNVTFSFGGHIVELAKKLKNIPFLQWIFPEPLRQDGKIHLNSVCGGNVNTSFLKRLGVDYRIIFAKPGEEEAWQNFDNIVHAYSIDKKMNSTKLLMIGSRAPGFYLSNTDELLLREKLGPELIHMSLATLLTGARKQSNDEIINEMKIMESEVDKITATEEMLEKTARVHLFLKNYCQENGIDGLSVKCWPELQTEYNFSICGVVSRLNAEGIITSCEGDIPGLVTMMFLNKLSGKSVAFLDLVNIERDNNILEAWHCGGIAHNLADNSAQSSYCEHPTIKQGIGPALDFPIKPGPVTVARLSELDKDYRLFLFEGRAERINNNYKGNTIRIKLDSDVMDVFNTIAYEGIEHHFAVVHSHIARKLRKYAELKKIKIISP